MAKNTRSVKAKEEEEFVALDELFLALSKRIEKVPVGKGQAVGIRWGIIAFLLIVASSVLFYLNIAGTWVPALVGAPAGVILYIIGLGVVKRTTVGEWSIFRMRENYSFKQRVRRIVFWFAAYALLFIPFGSFIPYGLGGSILISLVMAALATGRRTPEEIELAKKGIPDPRDLAEVEDKDDYVDEEDSEQPAPPAEADTLYYDKQRGGFGGKLK